MLMQKVQNIWKVKSYTSHTEWPTHLKQKHKLRTWVPSVTAKSKYHFLTQKLEKGQEGNGQILIVILLVSAKQFSFSYPPLPLSFFIVFQQSFIMKPPFNILTTFLHPAIITSKKIS